MSLMTIQELKAQGELDQARQAADICLLAGQESEELAALLAALAQDYRRAGRLVEAIAEMRRSLRLRQNPVYEGILSCWEENLPARQEQLCPYCAGELPQETRVCPHCARCYRRCPACGYANTLIDRYCRCCGSLLAVTGDTQHLGSLRWQWSYPCPQGGRALPPPVILGDLVIAPTAAGSLLALKIADGARVWELKDAFDPAENFMLSFSYPRLYIFAAGRVETVDGNGESTLIYQDRDFLPSAFSYPLTGPGIICFAGPKGLLMHRFGRRDAVWQPVEVEAGDAWHSPVAGDGGVYLLSRKGRLLVGALERQRLHVTEEALLAAADETCGPPVYWQGGLAYESLSQGQRRVNFFHPGWKGLSLDLPETLCSPDDEHFYHPPFLSRHGLLLVGDTEPCLYLVNPSRGLALRRVEIRVGVGPVQVNQLERTFSSFYDPYLFSRFPGGFLAINLDDQQDQDVEFLDDELLAAPLWCEKRLVVIGQREIKCYSAGE